MHHSRPARARAPARKHTDHDPLVRAHLLVDFADGARNVAVNVFTSLGVLLCARFVDTLSVFELAECDLRAGREPGYYRLGTCYRGERISYAHEAPNDDVSFLLV